MRRLPALAAALALAGSLQAASAADNVRIYRCTSSSGAVALQNAPCSGGRQQVLEMQRPQDPPPRIVSTEPAKTSPPPPEREVRIVTVQPPQPLYECIAPDGGRYTSDTAEGNARWVQTWVYGYPVGRPGPGGRHPAPARPPATGPRIPVGVVVPYSSSVMVRDECHVLPVREACARLSDRRWELIRRYNSAMPSAREQMTREQHGIEARLEQDCGGA